MKSELEMTCEHVIDLHPGAEGGIDLRFPIDERTDFAVALAAVDPAAGTAELVLDDMWNGYQMRQFVKDAGRWKPIWPGEDGNVRAVVNFGVGKHVNISSDLASNHSLDLTAVVWQGRTLRLTFRESG
jgi:hypothetical protein